MTDSSRSSSILDKKENKDLPFGLKCMKQAGCTKPNETGSTGSSHERSYGFKRNPYQCCFHYRTVANNKKCKEGIHPKTDVFSLHTREASLLASY